MKKWGMSVMALFFVLFVSSAISQAATHVTENFSVIASDPRIAEQMAHRAEDLRSQLALFWLGKELPNWSKRCRISVDCGNKLPGGSTSFSFRNGEVYGWDMQVWGSVERVYDSVLPHELTHTILASHFRTPLPRWADEGAATFTEHESERMKYRQQLYLALKSKKGIPLDKLFVIEEYPEESLPLYAHGFSLAEFLIRQRGPHYYVSFVDASLSENESWDSLVYEYYGYSSLRNLQNDWMDWVRNGMKDFVGSNLVAGNSGSSTVLMKQSISEEGEVFPTVDALNSQAYTGDLPIVPESRVLPPREIVPWSTTHK